MGRFPGGAAVKGVTPGSPASEAGLRVGDVIVAVNRQTLTSPKQAQELLQSRTEKDSLVVTVLRDGRAHYAVVKPRKGGN